MALRFFGVLIRQELSGIANKSASRMLSTTSVACAKILQDSPNAHLNKNLLNRYSKLKYDNKLIQATYVWIDGTGENVRVKDRVLDKLPQKPSDVPDWQYDGSSTYQALGGNSDIALVPQALYKDPFKAGENDVIVLCDTYKPDGTPCDSNHRAAMQNAYDRTKDQEPWFGIEQEYTFLDVNGRPLGWPENGFPAPQGPYYCGVGADKVVARDIVEAHALACLYAGVQFAGTNAEVMPGKYSL
jgi:glutamine synthetase